MSENTKMTPERFTSLVEAYGADMGRWPKDERFAAHDYATAAPEARALLDEAASIDALLAALPQPRLRPELAAAVVARIHAEPARQSGVLGALGSFLHLIWPSAEAWKPASVFASALVLGAVLGINIFTSSVSADEDVLAYAVPSLVQDLN